MAYYHGSIKLNRWEQFELNGDREQANKLIAPWKQAYGVGIAAQLGLLNENIIPKPTTSRSQQSQSNKQLKRKRTLSEDDATDECEDIERRKKKKKNGATLGKKTAREIDLWGFLGCSSGPGSIETNNKDERKLRKKPNTKRHKSICSTNDESGDETGDETRIENPQLAVLDKERVCRRLHSTSLQYADGKPTLLKTLKLNKGAPQKEKAEKQHRLQKSINDRKKVRESKKLALKEESEKTGLEVIYKSGDEKDKIQEENENSHKNDKESSDETRGNPFHKDYTTSDDEEKNDVEEGDDNEDEEKKEEERRRKHKLKESDEDTRPNRKHKGEVKQRVDNRCNSETSGNNQNDISHGFSDVKNKQRHKVGVENKRNTKCNQINNEKEIQALNLNKKPRKFKKKKFIIPKLSNKEEGIEVLVSPSIQSAKKTINTSREIMSIGQKHYYVQDDPTTILSNQTSHKSAKGGRPMGFPKRSCSHVVNVDAMSNGVVSPSKAVGHPKSSIKIEKERRISYADYEPTSTPDDEQCPSQMLTSNALEDPSPKQSSDTAGPITADDSPYPCASLIEKYPITHNAKQDKKDNSGNPKVEKETPKHKRETPTQEKKLQNRGTEALKMSSPVKVNLDANTFTIRDASKPLSSASGDNLKDWLRSVVKELGNKSTCTEKSGLSSFITLHSRFQVMNETKGIQDLEVSSGEDGNINRRAPIRIFTNIQKGDYQQHMEESLIDSIPDLIITRLYDKSNG